MLRLRKAPRNLNFSCVEVFFPQNTFKMHLTLINFFKKTVPGHIFRGKRRLVREVTFKGMRRLIAEYKMQEENMVYLKNPYITLVSVNQALRVSNQQPLIASFRNNLKDTLWSLRSRRRSLSSGETTKSGHRSSLT